LIDTSLFTRSEAFKRALVYWNRAALQGYHVARLKLGDYYYYGNGIDVDYQQAASHYKYATEISHNAQAMFNLAYMHEKGLGLKRDIHLAKRFYDLALETSTEAYVPVTLALVKLNFLFFIESFEGYISSASELKSLMSSSPNWDLYLMAIIAVLIAAVYRMRQN